MESDFHHRKSIRLPGYDYSQNGAYFITICTFNHESLFGKIVGARRDSPAHMELNELGIFTKNEWVNLSKRFTNIELDIFQIMPNHIHGIITVGAPLAGARLNNENINSKNNLINRATARVAPTHIGNIIGAYKSLVYTTYLKINSSNNDFRKIIWHRNYYEHIVRDDADMDRIREYIKTNPDNWEKDKLFNQ